MGTRVLRLWIFIFFTGVIVETGVLSFLRDDFKYYALPILSFTGAFLSCLSIFIFTFFYKKTENHHQQLSTLSKDAKYLIYILGSLFISYLIYKICSEHPIHPEKSDIIPTLSIMARRVLALQNPYDTVDFIKWSFIPAYLPMKFLPFTIAELLNIDYRYFAFVVFVIVLVIFSKELDQLKVAESFTKAIIPFLILYFLIKHNEPIFIHSVELIDASFILLLGFGISLKSWKIITLGIVTCSLSRYGIVMFFPILFYYLYLEFGKMTLLRVVGLSLIGVLVIYIFPYLSKDPMLFFKSMASYDNMAVHQWESIPSWHISKKPYTLSQGVGFAIFFNDFLPGTTQEKINIIKGTQILTLILWVVISCWVLYRFKIPDRALFILGSLKVYLLLFYTFIFVPFTYLFIVPLLFTIVPMLHLKLGKNM